MLITDFQFNTVYDDDGFHNMMILDMKMCLPPVGNYDFIEPRRSAYTTQLLIVGVTHHMRMTYE